MRILSCLEVRDQTRVAQDPHVVQLSLHPRFHGALPVALSALFSLLFPLLFPLFLLFPTPVASFAPPILSRFFLPSLALRPPLSGLRFLCVSTWEEVV